MRLRAVLAAALTTGALLCSPAVAAEDRITLSGTGSGWVDVDTNSEIGFDAPAVTTSGRFGGFYVEQLTAREPEYQRHTAPGGWVAVRGLSPQRDRLAPMRLGVPRTVPGRIRLYLIADGKTTVTIQTRDYRGGGRFTVKRPTRAQLHLTPLAQRGDVWQAVAPLRLPKQALALAAVHVTGDGSALSDVELCLRSPRGGCPEEPLSGTGATAAGNGLGPADAEQRWEHTAPQGLHVGNVVASATVDPRFPVRRAVLAAFSLTLAP